MAVPITIISPSGVVEIDQNKVWRISKARVAADFEVMRGFSIEVIPSSYLPLSYAYQATTS